jgi:hypothetical protein
MITKEQAIDMNNIEFHVMYTTELPCGQFNRNGSTKVWVTRPEAFVIPVKHPVSKYGSKITHSDAKDWHLASECPKDTQNILDNESATSVPS